MPSLMRAPLLVGLLALLAATACSASAPATTSASASADVIFVIPSGTESALERGDSAFRFPDEIVIQAGRSVVITNRDYAMHYFFDIPVAPGQTISKPFPRAGEFVYEGGLSCSISRANTIKVRAE